MHIQEFIQHILLRSYLKYSPSFTWMFLFLFWEGVLLMERNLLTEKIFSSVIWHIYTVFHLSKRTVIVQVRKSVNTGCAPESAKCNSCWTSANNLNCIKSDFFVEDANSAFMLQHCCWSSLSSSVWPAATMLLWEPMTGSTPCFCATAPGSPVPLERKYSQTYWQTCCSCWWSTAGLPLHRYRYLARNALENHDNNFDLMLRDIKPELTLCLMARWVYFIVALKTYLYHP